MTDKQIIVDGVDVSGCSLYEDNPKNRMWGTCDCMRSMVDQSGYDELAGAECKGYNCYYKQLKAKEQECEEFRKANDEKNELLAKLGCPTIATARRKVFCLQEQLDQLKAENDLFRTCHDNEQAKRRKYEQAIEDIKEIAEPYQKEIDKICGNCRRYDGCHACCMDTLNNYEYRTGTTKACDKFIELKDFDINKLANQILQKISECEVEND